MTDMLKANPNVPPVVPKELFTNLEKLAGQLLEEMIGDPKMISVVLSPGFDDFLTKWIMRSVHEAVANEEEDDDVMDVVEKLSRAKIDPTTMIESDFDEILKQIAETSLGAAAYDQDGDGGAARAPGEEDL